ncbi:MAG: zinc-ribbon domain-containing protein [Lentisphaeria bacterium]
MAKIEKICTQCGGKLLRQKDEIFQCESCQNCFSLQYIHTKCDHQLEEISGCGSISFFCKNCKLLVSTSEVKVSARSI